MRSGLRSSMPCAGDFPMLALPASAVISWPRPVAASLKTPSDAPPCSWAPVFTGFRYWWKLLRRIRAALAAEPPAVVIPIDSSFVNLRIAAIAKKLALPVCYYVAPQVWASRPWRVKKIARCVDTLCCMLPFEERYFNDRRVHAVYVGHPMFDLMPDAPVGSRESDSHPLDPPLPDSAGPHVAVFPGSRRAEIQKHMPVMLEILTEIRGRFPGAHFVAAAPSDERAWQIRRHLRSSNLPVEIRAAKTDAILRWADLAIIKSGTTVLQVARHNKPMVVMFSVPRWQWMIGRRLILTRHVAMINILAGREIVPEFVPIPSPLKVARVCIDLLSRPELRAVMQRDMAAVIKTLLPRDGIPATDRVADEVAKLGEKRAAEAGPA